jgi:hypothetical protein
MRQNGGEMGLNSKKLHKMRKKYENNRMTFVVRVVFLYNQRCLTLARKCGMLVKT